LKPRLSPRISHWLTRWQALVGLEPGRHEPGFLGPVPYVLLLRYFIAGAVIVRFWLHKPEYNDVEWWSRLLVFILILLATVAATYVTFFKPKLRRSQMLQAMFIMADVGFISAAYWLTNNPESDFFLFYYLPIFATVEYLEWKGTTAVCCAVGVAMLFVVFSMHPSPPPRWTHAGLVWRVLVPRAFFLLVVVLTSAFVFRGLARRQAELRSLLDSLHSSAAAMPDVQALDESLESILSELTGGLNCEFAAISLVDEYRNCIETVRGRNISPGWVNRARHDLDVPDIQTHIVRTGETRIIAGWDELLDKEIYDRFEHGQLARVWAPILSADRKVVGTIEAGCNKDREKEVLNSVAIERIKQLGRDKGDEIARKRPHVLLQGIAKDAIRLIGADSATLHVYRRRVPESSDAAGQEWGELILAAGAGKATPEFVKSDKPRRRGRGRKAIQSGEPEWIDDPREFQATYPELYSLGVRALAVVPLKLDSSTEGILGIHFWQSGKKFTPRVLNLADTFAREMEGIIQNYLLLRRATEASGRAWALSGLQSLMQSLSSPFHLPDVLKKIAHNALLTLDPSNVTVYQYHASENVFDAPPVTDGDFLHPDVMKGKVGPENILFKLIEVNKGSQFIVHAQGHPLLGASGANGKPGFNEREKVKSCAMLVLRPGEIGEIVGLIFVNFRDTHEFSSEERGVMLALANSAALAIKTARLHKDDVTRQLEAMRTVHETIAKKGPGLEQVFERLLTNMLELTGAKYGVFMSFNRQDNVLEAMAPCGMPADRLIKPQEIGKGIIGLAAKSKKSILVKNVSEGEKSIFVETVGDVLLSDAYENVNPDTHCELAVPVLDEDHSLLGVLNIEHTEPEGLDEDDKALLERLAVPAVIAIHTVDLYKQLERRIRHRSSLNLIASRVQEKPYEMDTIFRFFLTGITSGEGLGFSRAMLFLADPTGGMLRGESAIGPVTRQEAQEVWERFEHGKPSPRSDLDFLLRQAERFSEGIREGKIVEHSPLSSAIQQVSFPIDHAAGAASECLKGETGKTVTIECGQHDPFRETLDRLTKPNDVPHAFACVPLVGRHTKRIGVLVADNRFLWKEKAIDAEDVAGLEAFAGLLALTIENGRLLETLAEEQIAGIVHGVKNLITIIDGYEFRLRSSCQHFPVEMKSLLDGLKDAIQRALATLADLLNLTASTTLDRELVDLRDLIHLLEPHIRALRGGNLAESPVPLPVRADSVKLSNAVMAIVQNAHEAMANVIDGSDVIAMKLSAHESETSGQMYAQLEITDSGPGIPEKDRQKIFTPFFTINKKSGTGLGLAIADKVIRKHGGTIEALDNPGGGARFIIRLPMLVDLRNNSQGETDG
jgi:signal transduction histidine kinase